MIREMVKYCITIFLLFTFISCAQNNETNKSENICLAKFKLAKNAELSKLPINLIVAEIAKSFIGLEYKAKTLDQAVEENLVIDLTGLDCYTFLESSLAIARCIKSNKLTFNDYKNEIKTIRYRNGEIENYSSRLHYFSDWIWDVSNRKIVMDITRELGGEVYHNQVNFMSTHPEAYLQLKNDSSMVSKIEKIEKEISSRTYYYIPENKIKELEEGILTGDILGITTNIKGLDIAHTGIAIRLNDNRIHLLHAPNVGKKIQISKKPLAEYIMSHKVQTGIMVCRPTAL